MFFRKLYIILKDLSIDTPHGYVHRKKKFHPSVTCMGGPTPNSFFYYLVSYFCSGSYNTYSHQISSLQYLQFPSKSAVTDGQTDRRTDGHDETIRVPFLPFWLRNPKNEQSLVFQGPVQGWNSSTIQRPNQSQHQLGPFIVQKCIL